MTGSMSDVETIINDHCRRGSRLADLLRRHGAQVRDKALAVADKVAHLQPDRDFIARAAMLHDIGIVWTAAPQIHCHGAHPYVCHGVIGRHLLLQYGLTAHGWVCERHVGVGLTAEEIIARRLPLPVRDMRPVTLEETIICYADKFFSKSGGGKAHTLEEVLADLARFGRAQADRFLAWHRQLNLDSPH